MGVVYTPEQVRHREIANRGDQALIALRLLNLVEPDGVFVAGMAYGSTVYGCANRRSDVDVLMVFRTDREAEAEKLIGGVIRDARNDGIFASVEDHLEDDANRVLSTFDDLQYQGHLERTAIERPEWVKGDPLSFFDLREPTKDEIIRDAYGFIRGKMENFRRAGRREHPAYDRLQRALELPTAVGRKVFSVLDLAGPLKFDTVDKRSMKDKAGEVLLESIEKGVPNARSIYKAHELLRTLDDQYTELIDAIADCDATVKDHNAWMTANYYRAIESGRISMYGWQRILDMIVVDGMVQSR